MNTDSNIHFFLVISFHLDLFELTCDLPSQNDLEFQQLCRKATVKCTSV